jgi:hypothetical protein
MSTVKRSAEGRDALEVGEDLAHDRAVAVELAEVVPVRHGHADGGCADDLDACVADAKHRLQIEQSLPNPHPADVHAIAAVEISQPDALVLN